MMYRNPIPVVVGLLRCGSITDEQPSKLLAVCRAIEPFSGALALPDGYVDEGESAEVAIAREILEETTLATLPHDWRPVTTRITPDNRLLIFMLHRPKIKLQVLSTFKPTKEAYSLALVDELSELCFPLHTEILKSRGFWAW